MHSIETVRGGPDDRPELPTAAWALRRPATAATIRSTAATPVRPATVWPAAASLRPERPAGLPTGAAGLPDSTATSARARPAGQEEQPEDLADRRHRGGAPGRRLLRVQ